MKKRYLNILLAVSVSSLLVGCNKNNTSEQPQINTTTPIVSDEIQSDNTSNNDMTNENITPDENTVDTSTDTTQNVPKDNISSEASSEKNDKKESSNSKNQTNVDKINDLQKLKDETSILNKFLENISYLQEQHLKNFYDKFSNGTNKEDIINSIKEANFRYKEDIVLDYLYDDSGNFLDMEDRKGLVVYTYSNETLSNEKTTSADKIVLDAKKPYYNSYIVYIFNESNQLVGKFKTFNSDKNNFTFDETAIDGSLSFGSYSLVAQLESDVLTLYEKMDAVRGVIDENNKQIDTLITELNTDFNALYEAISEDCNINQFISKIMETGFGIEKMNKSNLQKINDRFIKDFTEGYYVYLTKADNQTSIDLRYSNYYINVIFDNNHNFYYKTFVNKADVKESGIDIKDASDYTLEEIKKNIKDLEEEIATYKKERSNFTDYLDKNINLLNNRIKFSMKYDEILSEIQASKLDYNDNYNNLSIENFKDKEGATVSAFDKNEQPKYDKVVQINGGTKDIYLFFKNNKLIGIYRSVYFDIADITIKEYKSLNTIKKGLSNLNKAIMDKESELKVYKTLLDQKETLLKNTTNNNK